MPENPAPDRQRAIAEFKRTMLWIGALAIVLVIGILWVLSLGSPLRPHMVVATVLGVFISTVLGCGLFAAAFFSDRSGHDRSVSDATAHREDDIDAP